MRVSSRLLRRLALAGLCCLLFVGCAETPEPETPTAAPSLPLTSRADTVAFRVFEAAGGPEAWAALPYLRFDFAFRRGDADRQAANHHLWDRRTGRYRLESPAGQDTTYVTLFDVDTREGSVYLNGAPVDSATAAARLERAYRSFINDTYWLLMPTKLFDPGVTRTYAADSSDAGVDVLHLRFGAVGLTPGDQYWVYADAATGRVQRWRYLLESGRENVYDWADPATFETAAGPLTVWQRKDAVGAPVSLLTDQVAMPATVPDSLFTAPRPLLAGYSF